MVTIRDNRDYIRGSSYFLILPLLQVRGPPNFRGLSRDLYRLHRGFRVWGVLGCLGICGLGIFAGVGHSTPPPYGTLYTDLRFSCS